MSKDTTKQYGDVKTLPEDLHETLAMAPVPMGIIGDGIVLWVNPCMEIFTGYTLSELTGESAGMFFLQDSLWENIRSGISVSSPFKEIDTVWRKKDGAAVDVCIRIAAARENREGTFLLTAMDITNRLRSEKELLQSEKRFRSFMDHLPAAVFLKDSQSRYIYYNRYMEEVIGADPTWLGKATEDCFPEKLAESLVKVDREAMTQGYRTGVEQVQDVSGNPRYFQTHKFRITGDDGDYLLGGIALDITEKLKVSKELQQSEELFRAFMDYIPGGIFLKDSGSKNIYLNRYLSDVFGADDSWIGKTTQQCFPGDAGARMMEEDKSVLSSGYSMYVERIHDCRGDERIFETHKFPIYQKEGKDLIGGITLDVTDKVQSERGRKNLEEQLQHTQKLESLGVLAGGIAHDFNNILMVILGYADLALLDLSPVNPARVSIQEIEKAARNAADLARQMLAYSGKGKFQLQSLCINDVIKEMTHLLEISISKKSVIKYHLKDELPSVEADASQIRQIVMNLITNASEALEDTSGVISISTGTVDCDKAYLRTAYIDEELKAGTYIFMEVSDTGCGMNDETRDRIFDPFFTTKFTGRGLGLSAVLGIVRGHKGALKVYSEPGRGTSFKIFLPSCGETIPRADVLPCLEMEDLKGGTILLVDDEDSVRSIGTAMLSRCGFDVIAAADGREALEIFRDNHEDISCVILDLTMPHLNGEEAFREMRRIQKDVKVIMSSGYNEHEVTSRFVGKGLAGFLQKPYKTVELLSLLSSILKWED